MYGIWIRVKAEEDLLRRKETLIGALWSNSNITDAPKAVRDLDHDFDRAIRTLWMTDQERKEEQARLEDSPFLKGMKPIIPVISDDQDRKAGMALGLDHWEVDQR